MKIRYRRCAALDVHKKTVCACLRKICGTGRVEIERETFGTCSCDLDRLGEWLTEHKVRRVAMESTGVYWIPVGNVLEATRFRLELMLVDPATVKALPGYKTDPKDAARITPVMSLATDPSFTLAVSSKAAKRLVIRFLSCCG